jgi:hypothetical protein
VDVLVNNAGYGYLTAFEEGDEAGYRAQFEANMFGLIAMTQAVLPAMRVRGSGHIVNIASVGGCDPHISQIQIEHAQIDVAGYWYRTCRVFADPARWSVSGTYYFVVDETWNGNGVLTGTLFLSRKVAQAGNMSIKLSRAHIRLPRRAWQFRHGRAVFR